MANTQNLIKWMTETRENLTFDKKVQLLKEFWDKRGRRELEEKERDLSTRVSNLENHANLLLNQKLSSTELIEELNNLKLLFYNADLPNVFELLAEISEQLLAISQIFETSDYDFEEMPSLPSSRPSSRSSSHSSSSVGEDGEKKIKELKQEIKFHSQQSANYLERLRKLEPELDNKDLEIEKLKATIRQLKNKQETEQEKAEKLAKERQKNAQKPTTEPEKKPPTNQTDRSNWFTSQHWLTDDEIDWAFRESKEQLELLGEGQKYKFLEATRFMYVLNAPKTREADAHLSLPNLVNDLKNFTGNLVFIPVNNPNFHWSLLVYVVKTKKFIHFDTLLNGNKEYVEPLVRALLQQIYSTNNINLEHYLLYRNSVIQENSSVCGVAIIAITERIIQEGGIHANLTDLNGNFEPERIKWQTKLNIIW